MVLGNAGFGRERNGGGKVMSALWESGLLEDEYPYLKRRKGRVDQKLAGNEELSGHYKKTVRGIHVIC